MLQDLRVDSLKSRPWAGVATAAMVVIVAGSGYGFWRSQAPQQSANHVAVVVPPQPMTVTALGRLEPEGEVIRLVGK